VMAATSCRTIRFGPHRLSFNGPRHTSLVVPGGPLSGNRPAKLKPPPLSAKARPKLLL
jgi:hypothetical protein